MDSKKKYSAWTHDIRLTDDMGVGIGLRFEYDGGEDEDKLPNLMNIFEINKRCGEDSLRYIGSTDDLLGVAAKLQAVAKELEDLSVLIQSNNGGRD